MVIDFRLPRHEPESEPESRPESRPESLANKILTELEAEPLSKAELARRLGQKKDSGQLNRQIRTLLEERKIERTIPEKPTSRLQKYRIMDKADKATGEFPVPGSQFPVS